MRDLIFSALMIGLLPVSFRRPLIGLLTFSWLAYMRAQDLTWGFAKHQRWSFLVAAVTLAGWAISSQRRPVVRNWRTAALVGLAIWVGISLFLSVPTPRPMTGRYIEYVKIIGVALFTTSIVTKVEHLRMLVWVIALSFAFYGVKIGLAGVLTGGTMTVNNGPGGMLQDNNDFALALCMGLPLLIQTAASERNPVLRRGVWIMVPLTVLTIIMTHSRGGFLSLSAMALMLIWRSRNRVAAFSILAAAALLAVFFTPDSYFNRISSISNFQEDGSAMGRLAAWHTATLMAIDNPLFGVGLYKFRFAYRFYMTGAEHEMARATHNAYFQIWSECGTPALLMYMFLIAATFWSLAKVRARAKQLYTSSWILNYASMFEACMLAFVVGSSFLSRAHYDLFYHLVAIVVCFEVVAVEEMGGLRQRQPGGLRGISFRVLSPRGFRRPRARAGFRDASEAGQPA